MSENIRSFRELRVFQPAFEAAMELFTLSKKFPPEEKYSLTDPSNIVDHSNSPRRRVAVSPRQED